MKCVQSCNRSALFLLGIMLLLGGKFCLAAQPSNNSKKPAAAAPAKPAPAPKPAASSAPAAKPASGSTAPHIGATANGPAANSPHGGPAANGPRGNFAPATGPHAESGRAEAGHGLARPGSPSKLDRNGRPTPARNTEVKLRTGQVITKRPDGRIGDLHDPNRHMDVYIGLNGVRRVEVVHPGGVRVVVVHGRPGFVEHPFAFRGHDLARRTFVYQGRVYSRFYRGYSYRGHDIHVFAPNRYYGAGFYGWAYHPWARPVVFAWGWGPSPWYGYYGYYFAPYPTYPSASYWLTDYMISSDLQANYQAYEGAGSVPSAPAAAGGPVLTPEVKQAISQEVQNQIALENAVARQNAAGQDPDPVSSGIARMLSDGQAHVFVSGANLDVVDAAGAECSISPGDALQFNPPADPNAPAVNLVVLASKGGAECQRANTVTVAVSDLQEMQNHMRETIDDGLAKLQAQQGSGGLPSAPPSAQAPATNAAFAPIAPPQDPGAAAEISQQEQQANIAQNEAAAGGGQ